MNERKDHWDAIFQSKGSHELAWFQPHLKLSMELIQATGIGRDAPILDVGGGDSTLVDDLLDMGYSNLTVLDVSAEALGRSQARLAERAGQVAGQQALQVAGQQVAGELVALIEGDITQVDLPSARFQLWHDRAVFHFLTDPVERGLYILAARRSLQPGGYVIVATFAKDGPEKCSGLPVVRYDAESLSRELGSHFRLIKSCLETHQTPWGGKQSFQYSLFQHILASP